MTNKINILGCNHESINAAIFLASLDWQVSLIATSTQVNTVLSAYQFDRQLSLLWQLYTADTKIITGNKIEACDNFWVFFDDGIDSEFRDYELQFKSLLKSSSQVLLSGAKAIGFFDNFATTLKTNWVYYVPFNFLKDGNNFNAFFNIELLLIGEKTKNSVEYNDILKKLIKNSQKYSVNTIKTIEFTRASINAMLATRLSFINEIARLADSESINIEQVQMMMGMDSRIGEQYLKAGWGFGGKSLPNELGFLMDKFSEKRVDTSLLRAVSDINTDQKELIFRKFWQYFDSNIDNKHVVIWGAGYRTGTGRTTGSAIHSLVQLCWNYGIKTSIYAVNTSSELNQLYNGQPLFCLIDNPYDELNNADALFVLNWDNQKIDIERLNKIALPIFDAKNIFDDEIIKKLSGFYIGIGKQK